VLCETAKLVLEPLSMRGSQFVVVRLSINVTLLDTGKSLSFNGKPKAPASNSVAFAALHAQYVIVIRCGPRRRLRLAVKRGSQLLFQRNI
jgi:hypothetical protein